MHPAALLTLTLLTLATALPLNINLGAYSPAIVVGDGAISFEEGESVTSIVNALQGAAIEGAASANAAAAAAAVAPPTVQAAAAAAVPGGPILNDPVR